jgi:hypothetical protein
LWGAPFAELDKADVSSRRLCPGGESIRVHRVVFGDT